MPLVTSNEILTQVNDLLNDEDFFRWTKPELLRYFNAAQKAILLRRPDAYTIDVDDFTCISGTKQKLPDDSHRLIDVPRNFVSGRAITGPHERSLLDDSYPTWFAGNDAESAELFIYDERNPKTFYIYPGVVAGTKLTIVISKVPPITTLEQNNDDQVIALDDIYENAIIEWILYRCYSKDAEYASNSSKALMHLNAFKAQIGEKSQADSAMSSETIKE